MGLENKVIKFIAFWKLTRVKKNLKMHANM